MAGWVVGINIANNVLWPYDTFTGRTAGTQLADTADETGQWLWSATSAMVATSGGGINISGGGAFISSAYIGENTATVPARPALPSPDFFIEATMTQPTGAGNPMFLWTDGPRVTTVGDQGIFVVFLRNGEVNFRIQVRTSGFFGNLAELNFAAGHATSGDLFRLEVTGPASAKVARYYKNGTLQGTIGPVALPFAEVVRGGIGGFGTENDRVWDNFLTGPAA